MTILRLRRFGDPILRQAARRLKPTDIKSGEIRLLITDMRYTNEVKKYGVGLAAPQVGVSVAVAIIMIRPSKNHSRVQSYDQVIINPSYVGIGQRRSVYEGCLSTGTGKHTLFGKTLLYPKIQATWLDEHGVQHTEQLDGLVAHVFQHETNHLDGVLFVDHVRDSRSYMMADEYRKKLKSNRR